MSAKNLVKVVIPLYRTDLTQPEWAALSNNVRRLSGWPIVFVTPEGLDVSGFMDVCPSAENVRVTSDWLGKRNGIAGYNRMMMSSEFYRLFEDTEYILICHVDAWIFTDNLAAWCAKGYDVVAAP